MSEKNWNYYKYIAENCNKIKIKNEQGEISETQSDFSFFEPFYEKSKYSGLNPILKSFLNDGKNLPGSENNIGREKLDSIFDNLKKSEKNFIAPNDIQKVAILNALNNPLSLVQGPPGTGKTETIINIIRTVYMLNEERGENKTIAVVSNNKEALNNIYDIFEIPQFNIDKCVEEKFAKLGNYNVRADWIQKHKDENAFIVNSRNQFSADYLEKRPFFTSTLHSLCKVFILPKNISDYTFDYVIVDESSQSNITLGLIAMGVAKHLVVLGDNEQLSAIISQKITDLNNDTEKSKIDDKYKEKEDYNFLAACEEIFDVPKTILNEHYRCHSSIIKFCNDNIYQKKLKPNTAKDGYDDEFRMRAVWYEGNYHLRTRMPYKMYADINNKDEEDYREAVKHSLYGNFNIHQIRIFLEEELPRFLKRNNEYRKNNGKNLSIGVIAPYRAHLNILDGLLMLIKEACMIRKNPGYKPKEQSHLDEKVYEKINNLYKIIVNEPLIDKLYKLDFDEIFSNYGLDAEEESETDWLFPCLTVHKSQGKGYDHVYFFAIVDSDNNWVQKKRMINVAVSRAKKEFCIIMGEHWLEKSTIGKTKDDMFLCKLIKYIDDNTKNIDENSEYGFHKCELSDENTIKANELLQKDLTETKLLVEQRDTFIDNMYQLVCNAYNSDIHRNFLNFRDPAGVNYKDKIVRALYHCKYTTAYSFEYAMLWDIILRSYMQNENNDNNLSVLSLGCGAMTEAWSLEYAKSRLKKAKELEISFTGVDEVNWNEYLTGDKYQLININLNDLTEKPKSKIIILPKILNHLSEKEIKETFELCKECLDDSLGECYLCISHNKSFVVNKEIVDPNENLKRIDKCLTDTFKDDYDICGDINEMLNNETAEISNLIQPLERPEEITQAGGIFDQEEGGLFDQEIYETEQTPKYPCYVFKNNEQFYKINEDFRLDMEIIKHFIKINNSNDTLHANCMTTVKHFAFQIIKLTKK